MTCDEFELRLDEALDRREPLSAAEFAPHMAKCSACQRAFEGAKLLSEAIVASRANLPRIDLADRVLEWKQAEVRPQSVDPWASRRVSFRITAAAVTAVAMLVILGLQFARQPPAQPPVARTTPAPRVVEGPRVAQTPVPREEPPQVEVDELVETAKTAYLALAQDAAHTLRDAAAVIVPDKASVPTLDSLPKAPKMEEWRPTLPDGFGAWLDKSG